MNNGQKGLVVLVLCLFLTTGWSGGIRTSLISASTTSTPAGQSSLPEGFKDFAGKWIAYNVDSLVPGQPTKVKPGMRLEISEIAYSVDAVVCEKPVFKIRETGQKEFLSGKKPPIGAFELDAERFPLLSSGCSGLEPSSVARVNERTLAAVIGSDLLYFESDLGIIRGDMTVESEMLTDASRDPLYEIHAQVPVLQKPADQAFNDLARQIVTTGTDGFRNNFKDWKIPAEMAGYKSFLWVGYDVPLLTAKLISVRFSVDYYMAGAAHPNHYFKVLNYDLASGKTLQLSDVFKDTPAALELLSRLCKTDLDKPDITLFPEGLAPDPENYKNWNLTDNGLRMSFDPYQVAPYAAGPQEVLIPYSTLIKLIDPQTTVGAFIAY